jgi:hypothetical protein
MKIIWILCCLCATTVLVGASETNDFSSTRYGLFDLLDHSSQYGQGIFPEPFLVDDSDLEPNEARFDWLHRRAGDLKSDSVKAEIEHAFGLMTMELEVPYERDSDLSGNEQGFGNISLGARYPIYQYVSRDGLVDETMGIGVELGFPSGSPISRNTELVPKIFSDLKVGNFTTQSVLGYSTKFGPGDEGGLQTFEYGFVFGYTVPHRRLPLPAVLETIPFFEVLGETEMNKDTPGHTSILGDAGLRFNMKAIGRVQPRPGIGFVFPLNSEARQETHWGVIVSLVFQY